MNIWIDGVRVSPREVTAAEVNFGQARFRGLSRVVLQLSVSELLELLGVQLGELLADLLGDVEVAGAGELSWWVEEGFPALDELLERHPARVADLVKDYFGDRIWWTLRAADSPRDPPVYCVNVVDDVAISNGELRIIGAASRIG